jgi:hypothetical protein
MKLPKWQTAHETKGALMALVLIILLLVALSLTGCTSFTKGTVTVKEYTPAHIETFTERRSKRVWAYDWDDEEYQWKTNWYDVAVERQVPDTYTVTITGYDKDDKPQEAQFNVDKATFDQLAIGAWYDKEATTNAHKN